MPHETFTITANDVSDGEHSTGLMPTIYDSGYISISFNTTDGSAATNTGGTIVFSGTDDGVSWGEIASVLAANVGPNVEYVRPAFSGPLIRIKMVLAGVAGDAESASVTVSRYSS